MGNRWQAIRAGEITIPVNDTFGFELDPSASDTEVVLSWTVPENLCNSAGTLQGGVIAAFADAVLGGAAALHLEADQYPALAEMKISIFRPAPAGMNLTGKGRVLKAGRRVLFVEAEITDTEGRLIAKASATEIPAQAP